MRYELRNEIINENGLGPEYSVFDIEDTEPTGIFIELDGEETEQEIINKLVRLEVLSDDKQYSVEHGNGEIFIDQDGVDNEAGWLPLFALWKDEEWDGVYRYKCHHCGKFITNEEGITTLSGSWVCDNDTCRTLDDENEATERED